MLRDIKKGRSFVCSNEGGDEKDSWNRAREFYKHATNTRVSIFLILMRFFIKDTRMGYALFFVRKNLTLNSDTEGKVRDRRQNVELSDKKQYIR